MPYGMYISAEGAMAQNRRLEVIANNLANVDTVGFKRDLAIFQARYAEATERGLDQPGSGSINDLGGGIKLQATATDYSPGPLEPTGRPTDLAIEGDAFFTVLKGDDVMLTRAGNFLMRETGELVTGQGYPVLDDSGAPVQLDPSLPYQITDDGMIQQAGGLIPLGLVRPLAAGDLARAEDNLLRPLAPPVPLDLAERRVHPGYLEMSGVKPTLEMMSMIETSRAFEANINLIRGQDQIMGTLISRVLRST